MTSVASAYGARIIEGHYRWIIYLRQSSDGMNSKNRTVSESIKTQRERCEAEIRRVDPNPISIVNLTDQNRSAKRGMTRPARDELLRMLDSGEANAVMAYKATRIARDIGEAEEIWRAASDRTGLLLTTERVDLSNAAIRGFFFGVAAQENQERSEYSMNSLLSRKERGLPPLKADSAHGVRWKGNELVGDARELPVVRFVYEQYDQGESMAQIARELSAQNAPRRRGRTNQWDTHTVSAILKSSWYAGLVPDGLGGIWSAGKLFLDAELISRVQARSRSYKAAPRQMNHPLSGLLYCGVCAGESPMTVCYSRPPDSKKTYIRYRCVRHVNNRELCPGNSIGAAPVERFILAAAREITGTDEVSQMRFARHKRQAAEAMITDAKDHDQRISALEEKRDHLYGLLTQGYDVGGVETFNAEMRAIESEIAAARAERERLIGKAALSQKRTNDLLAVLEGQNQLSPDEFLALPAARRQQFYQAMFPDGLRIGRKAAPRGPRKPGEPKLCLRDHHDLRAWERITVAGD